jgi:NAD(P)-dependent dehydrogenase (short-subunit alcohol dehydrogenase family)
MELAGKAAVVTGAASGIGLAIADRFAAEGMTLVVADVERRALEKAAAALSERTEVLAVPTDVTDPAAVEKLRDATVERFGDVHVVCNNAGVGGFGVSTWDGPIEAWEWVLGVNLWGVIHGVRAFVPLMLEQDAGHVVNTASLAGLRALPGFGPYTASKHAVLAISEALHHELAMLGSSVRVHVLCPGFLRTGIADSDRNWPERLGPRPRERTDEMAQSLRQLLHDLVDSGLPPQSLADALIDAMQANRFFVTTHPEVAAALAAQRAAIVDGGEPELPDIF